MAGGCRCFAVRFHRSGFVIKLFISHPKQTLNKSVVLVGFLEVF